MSYNRISSLPRYIVDQLHHLVSIDLAHNELVWLDVGAFSSASLRYVDLSHNSLRKLVSMTFLYLPAIVHIDLSNNKVCRIHRARRHVGVDRLGALGQTFGTMRVCVSADKLCGLIRH